MSRKLEQKQQRRLAEEQRRKETKRAARRRNLSFAIVILLVAGLVVGLIVSERLGESDTGGEPVGTTASRAGCTEAQKSPEEGHEHVPDDTQVDYETTPPTSGNHYATPAAAGFYPPDAAGVLPDEALVHNLEHGQIVFWYDPDAPGVADDLQDLIDKQPARYAQALVAAPYDKVPDSFTFTMTSWTFSSSCKAVSEEAINEFRADHQGVDGREQFTPPFTP